MSGKPIARHGYWITSKGPCDISGVSLRYVEDYNEHLSHIREQAIQAKDERWLSRINSMADRNADLCFTTPEIGWWTSKSAYAAGEEGFSGCTRGKVEKKHPLLTIHESRIAAIAKFEGEGGGA